MNNTKKLLKKRETLTINKTANLKNMKNAKNLANNLPAKLILIVVVFAAACSSLSSGVTRTTAVSAIEADKRYSAAMAMSIDVSGRFNNAGGATVYQTSADDTAETALVRAKTVFAEHQPQIAVAEHLGFIKLYFEKPELGEAQMGHKNYGTALGLWNFKTRAELTSKGRALWEDLKLSLNEQSLPIAVRTGLDVTGIADENQNSKRADFNYKWQPTELGEAFDPSSPTYAKLPEDLQNALKSVQQNMFIGGKINPANFNASKIGIARFKKFDDGWRMADLLFIN